MSESEIFSGVIDLRAWFISKDGMSPLSRGPISMGYYNGIFESWLKGGLTVNEIKAACLYGDVFTGHKPFSPLYYRVLIEELIKNKREMREGVERRCEDFNLNQPEMKMFTEEKKKLLEDLFKSISGGTMTIRIGAKEEEERQEEEAPKDDGNELVITCTREDSDSLTIAASGNGELFFEVGDSDLIYTNKDGAQKMIKFLQRYVDGIEKEADEDKFVINDNPNSLLLEPSKFGKDGFGASIWSQIEGTPTPTLFVSTYKNGCESKGGIHLNKEQIKSLHAYLGKYL